MSPSEPGTAYVLKMYPRFSETFIVSEILAREAAGDRIEIFSLLPTDDARFHPELARVQAPVTYIDRPIKTMALWESLRLAEEVGLTAALGRNFAELAAVTADEAVQAINLATALQGRNIRHMHVHFASGATTVARLASFITGIPFSFTAHAVDIFHESVRGRGSAAQARAGPPRRDHQPVQHALPAPPLPGLDVPAPPGAQRPGAGALPVPGAPPARTYTADRRHRPPGGEERLPASAARGRRTAGPGGQNGPPDRRDRDSWPRSWRPASTSSGSAGTSASSAPRPRTRSTNCSNPPTSSWRPAWWAPTATRTACPRSCLRPWPPASPASARPSPGSPRWSGTAPPGSWSGPGNSHALARGIRTLGSAATDRHAVSRNARAVIEEDYDVHRQAELLRSLSRPERRVA